MELTLLRLIIGDLQLKCYGNKEACEDLAKMRRIIDHMDCKECSYSEFLVKLKYTLQEASNYEQFNEILSAELNCF